MYTKRIFTPRELLAWTRYELIVLVVLAALPVVAYDLLGQHWLRFPWLPVALVGTAVAFMLSFQNNAAYDRVWEARKIWGGIVNASRAWAMMVNDYVSDLFANESVSEDELRTIRKRMITRHVAWMTALRYALRAPRPWEGADRARTDREWTESIHVHEHHVSLEDDIKEYVPDGEAHVVCGSANPAAQILAKQSKELGALRERGLIDDFRHMEMQGVLNRLVDGQGKSERIKNFPYPRQYATLNATFLWVFLALIPFGLVHEFSEIGAELNGHFPTLAKSFVWLTVPFSTLVMWIFHTMERIGRVTENPFSGSVNDIPITTMSRGIEIDLRQMIGDEPSSIPDPVVPRRDTQM